MCSRHKEVLWQPACCIFHLAKQQPFCSLADSVLSTWQAAVSHACGQVYTFKDKHIRRRLAPTTPACMLCTHQECTEAGGWPHIGPLPLGRGA